jgi:hypothetical protein
MLTCLSNNAISRREKLFLVKKKKNTEPTISHLCGTVKPKNILAETDYRFKKYAA